MCMWGFGDIGSWGRDVQAQRGHAKAKHRDFNVAKWVSVCRKAL